jgi:ubiquinone/menaquinone biosynthesis C-methylase UbiE
VSAERALSFGSVAEDYEATRPGWPREAFAIAFEQFDLPERPDIVDVAAGTGKLTRTLAELAGTLVAVEPDAALRAVLGRELPAVTVLEGTAEALPLPTAGADAVCAGQAFHWFDVDRALDEFARVLRRQGIAIAAWNTPPEEGTWYDAVIDYLKVANPDHLPATNIDWAEALAAHPLYGGLVEIAERHEQPTTRAAFRRLLGTHSLINVLPEERRSELIEQALAVADAEGAFDADGSCAIPWRCELFVLRRRD